MKELKILVTTLLIILFFYGCGSASDNGGDSGRTTAETTISTQVPSESSDAEPKTPEPAVDPIILKMADMTLDEKIGQLLFFGFAGTELDERAIEVINSCKPGGLIVMGENVKSAEQLLALLNSLKAESSKNVIPAFISVDEEGGRVSRMPPDLKDIPAAGKIGKTGSEEIANSVGTVIAEELTAFGFNMDFAPVLDIWSNPKNTVIGDRSLGTDADTVGRLGVQVMKGISSKGIIPVVKHFPGHGDTIADSHKELPVSDSSLERLKSFELKPFVEAAGNSADAVMVAHILLPQVDAEYPASLSRTFITDILRTQIGFDGVVITDDMTMAAISKNYGLAEAALMSFKAGSDMILLVHGYDDEVAVAGALKNAVQSGEIPKDRLDESVYRILKLKEKYRVENVRVDSVDIEKLNRDIEKVDVAG